MVDKMAIKSATTENDNKGKIENLIKEIEDLIKEKLRDKILSKNYPFIKESEPTAESKPDNSLPLALKNFGKKEEKNWIFYGPPGTGKTFALNKIFPTYKPTYKICINNTLSTQKCILKLYELIPPDIIKILFYQILNRFIGIPFKKNHIEIYLKCTKDRNPPYFKSVIGTEEIYKHSADPIFKKDNSYEFKKENEDDKDCLTIVPTLIQNDKIDDLINVFDKIKEIVIEIVNLNLEEQKYQDVTKIVFHPSYTYEDFVGGIKPDLVQTKSNDQLPPPSESSSPNSLTYKYTRGVMLDLIRKAWDKKGVRHYLIIDEFNRGNIAAIFGEFLYLIENDKRSEEEFSGDNYVFLPGGVYPWNDKEKVEPFSEECKIRMPKNIFIVGALNTADRSIATMDFAMRRRFNFVKFEPNEELIKGFGWNDKINVNADDYLKFLFVSLNKSINYKLDADHEIGHYYFMPTPEIVKKNTETFLEDLFEQKIIPLLEAYCDHDEQAVNRILELTKKIMKNDCSEIKEEKIVFEIVLSTQGLKKMDREFAKDSKTENLIKKFWNPVEINKVVIKKLAMKSSDIGATDSKSSNLSDSQ